MEGGLILLVAALMVHVAPGVQGTAHLSYANTTQVNITGTGCGATKLCVETPDDCYPTARCLFASVVASTPVAPNGSELSIQLSGDSMGYIALGLAVNASVGTIMLFICAQNSSDNGTFFFQTMQNTNTNATLTPTEMRVTEIRGAVNGSLIQCEFNIPNMNATNTDARTSQVTTFSVLLGTGTVDTNALGPLNISQNRGPLDLANPASNVPTTGEPSMSTTVESNMSTTVESNMSTTVEPSMSTTVESNMSTTVESSMSTTVESNMSTTVEPSMSTTGEPSMSTTGEPNPNTNSAKPSESSGAVHPHAVLLPLSVLMLLAMLSV